MMKLTEYEQLATYHVLVYGDPKTGKSTLVSQLAEQGFKLIWFSFDNGHSVLKKLSSAAQDNIELIIVPDTRDYPVAVDVFREVMKMKPVSICFRHGKHGCSICKKEFPDAFSHVNLGALTQQHIVVFDNISQLSDSYQALVTKGKDVDYKLQLDDYGALLFHLKKGFTDVQQAPFNIVCIAHAVEEQVTDGNKRIMPAVGSSSFAPKVAGYFDHIIYCHTLNKAHKFGSATTYITNVIAGSRFDKRIEDLKDKPSLLPFFDGTEKPAVGPQGAAQAAAVIAAVVAAVTPVVELPAAELPAALSIVTDQQSASEKAKAKLALLKGRRH